MENTIVLNSGQEIEVLLQDEVSLDIDCSLRYIESGKAEIGDYVKNTAKPQLDQVVIQAETEMDEQIAKGIADASAAAEEAAAIAVRESIVVAETEIDSYVNENITPELNQSVVAAAASASEASQFALNAGAAASSAENIVAGFDDHAKAVQAGFDANAAAKTTAFNDNADARQTQIDASAAQAAASAANSAQSAADAAASSDEAREIVKSVSNGWNIFDHKWSDHKLNDINWLMADTFSWQSGSVYSAAYNFLVGQYNDPASAETSDTIAEITIVYKTAPNGIKIAAADQENNIQSLYNATGVAWYYILDTTALTFKLPRTKFGFTGLRNQAGAYVSESLPNIRGALNGVDGWSISASGAMIYNRAGGAPAGSNSGSLGNIDFSASRSSSAYQDAAPVQERATEMYLYFYIGEYQQSAVAQTAGLNTELFNGKADVGKLAGASLPSDHYAELILGASGAQYTAPAAGWLSFRRKTSGSNQYLELINETANISTIVTRPSEGNTAAACLPCQQGDLIRVYYSAAGDVIHFKFVYAKGEN